MADLPQDAAILPALMQAHARFQGVARWIEFITDSLGGWLSAEDQAKVDRVNAAISAATSTTSVDEIEREVDAMITGPIREDERRRFRGIVAELHRRDTERILQAELQPTLRDLVVDGFGRFRIYAINSLMPDAQRPGTTIQDLAALFPELLEQIDNHLLRPPFSYRAAPVHEPYSPTMRALARPGGAISAAVTMLEEYVDAADQALATEQAITDIARWLQAELGEEAFSAWLTRTREASPSEQRQQTLSGLELATDTATRVESAARIPNLGLHIRSIVDDVPMLARLEVLAMRRHIDNMRNQSRRSVAVTRGGSESATVWMSEFDSLLIDVFSEHPRLIERVQSGNVNAESLSGLARFLSFQTWLGRNHGVLLQPSSDTAQTQATEPDVLNRQIAAVSHALTGLESQWIFEHARAARRVTSIDHLMSQLLEDPELLDDWMHRTRPNFDRTEPLQAPAPDPPPDLDLAWQLIQRSVVRGDLATVEILTEVVDRVGQHLPDYIEPPRESETYKRASDGFFSSTNNADRIAQLALAGELDGRSISALARHPQGWRTGERLIINAPELVGPLPEHLEQFRLTPPESHAAVRPIVDRLVERFSEPTSEAQQITERVSARLLEACDRVATVETAQARTRTVATDSVARELRASLGEEWYQQSELPAVPDDDLRRQTDPSQWPDAGNNIEGFRRMASELASHRVVARWYQHEEERLNEAVGERASQLVRGTDAANAFVEQVREIGARHDVGATLPAAAAAARTLGPDDRGDSFGRDDDAGTGPDGPGDRGDQDPGARALDQPEGGEAARDTSVTSARPRPGRENNRARLVVGSASRARQRVQPVAGARPERHEPVVHEDARPDRIAHDDEPRRRSDDTRVHRPRSEGPSAHRGGDPARHQQRADARPAHRADLTRLQPTDRSSPFTR